MHPEQDYVTTQAGDAPGNDATIDTDDLVEQLKGEIEQLRARSLVEHADLENQRKRLERDVRNACRFANKQLLGDLLPVFDSLRSEEHTSELQSLMRISYAVFCLKQK